MKVMILAAGRGERLRPLTDHTPKPLLHAGPKRLIEYLIEKLVDAGLNDIVINHAHLGEQFEPILGSGERYHAHFEYSAEVAGGLETAGGIIQALPILGNEPFLVVNGDIWTDFPFADLAKIELSTDPAGDFYLESEGLLSLEGEPKLTFSGIGIYRPEMFAEHPVAKRALKPFFVEVMKQKKATGQHYQGQWSDIGTVERLTLLAKQLDI